MYKGYPCRNINLYFCNIFQFTLPRRLRLILLKVCLKNAGNCRSQSLPCTSRMVDHGRTAVSVINDEYLSVYYIQNIYSRLLYVSLEAFCLESRPIFFIRQIPSPERDSRRELIIIKVSLDDRRDSELSFHKLTFKHLLLCFVERRSNLLLPCNTV